MSDPTATIPTSRGKVAGRPVSLITIVFVFGLFAAAIIMARYLYAPSSSTPQDAAAENLTKDLEWRATAPSRRAAFVKLNEDQLKKVNSYGWIDQKGGVVQLPIERAMELTVQKYGAKK